MIIIKAPKIMPKIKDAFAKLLFSGVGLDLE
jgi:hypothetical protein